MSAGAAPSGITPGSGVRLRAVGFAPDGQGGWRSHREPSAEITTRSVGHGRSACTRKGLMAPNNRVEVCAAQQGGADTHLSAGEAVVFL